MSYDQNCKVAFSVLITEPWKNFPHLQMEVYVFTSKFFFALQKKMCTIFKDIGTYQAIICAIFFVEKKKSPSKSQVYYRFFTKRSFSEKLPTKNYVKNFYNLNFRFGILVKNRNWKCRSFGDLRNSIIPKMAYLTNFVNKFAQKNQSDNNQKNLITY